MHIECLNEDISNILSFLDKDVNVLVVSASNPDTLATVSNHFLILDCPHYLNHFVYKIVCLEGTHDSLVLSQATSKTPDEVLNVDGWLISYRVSI